MNMAAPMRRRPSTFKTKKIYEIIFKIISKIDIIGGGGSQRVSKYAFRLGDQLYLCMVNKY